MPQTLRVPLADLTPAAPAQTPSRLRVSLADLTPVVSRPVSPRPVPPRVATPLPAAATRGMLPPSTMAGDPVSFPAPSLVTARPQPPTTPSSTTSAAPPFNAPRMVTAIPPSRARGAGPVGQPTVVSQRAIGPGPAPGTRIVSAPRTDRFAAMPEPNPATFLESVGRGVDVAQQLGYGALEAAGELTGLDAIAGVGRRGRQRNAAAVAGQPRAALTDIKGVGDFAQWAKETIGEQIPIMAPMLASGAAGAAVGSVVPGIGTTIGGVIGAVVPALAFGVGEVQSAIKERGEDQSAPGMAFLGGSAIAALDTILPAKVGSRLVKVFGGELAEEIAKRALLKPVSASVIRRTAKGAATGLATEGFTEALQEAVGEVAAATGTGTAVSPTLPLQMLEAGAAGALVGGVAAGAGSMPAARRRQPPPEAPPPLVSPTPSAQPVAPPTGTVAAEQGSPGRAATTGTITAPVADLVPVTPSPVAPVPPAPVVAPQAPPPAVAPAVRPEAAGERPAPAAKGFVRLYRGDAVDPVVATATPGRWFSRDPSVAEFYTQFHGQQSGGTTRYVDVSEDQYATLVEEARLAGDASGYLFLDEATASKSVPLAAQGIAVPETPKAVDIPLTGQPGSLPVSTAEMTDEEMAAEIIRRVAAKQQGGTAAPLEGPRIATTNASPSITYNSRLASVEVGFQRKPERAVLDTLKHAGFRWDKTNKRWYQRDSAKDEARAIREVRDLLGVKEPGFQAPEPPRPYDTGKAAFAAGATRVVPRELIGRGQAESWYQGWDDANLAEPVLGVATPSAHYAKGQTVEMQDFDGKWYPTEVISDTDTASGMTQVWHPTIRMQPMWPPGAPATRTGASVEASKLRVKEEAATTSNPANSAAYIDSLGYPAQSGIRRYLVDYAAWLQSKPGSGPAPNVPTFLTGTERHHLKEVEAQLQKIGRVDVAPDKKPVTPQIGPPAASTKGRLIPTRRADGTVEYKVEAIAPEAVVAEPSADLDARRAENKAKREALFAKLTASLNRPKSGIDPTDVTLMVGIIRTYVDDGIVEFERAWRQFVADFAKATSLTEHFETAWEMLRGETRTVASLEEKAQTKGEEPDAATASRGDRSPLAGTPSKDGAIAERYGADGAEQGSAIRNGPDRRRGERGDSGGAVDRRGPGTIPARVGLPAERGGRSVSAGGPQPHDLHLTASDTVAIGGPKQRVEQNLAAITTLKTLESENRPATAEEQRILVRYVGWGGLSTVFNESHKDYSADLRAALTDTEYEAARASTPNAHYTSLPVIQGVYDALTRLGVSGPIRMLEPAAGVGHFLGMMPTELSAQAARSAVEMDGISGRITAALYPHARVQVTPLQQARLPQQGFDLVVSNVPFGNYQVADPSFRGRPKALASSIHNYYFAKALDLTRPGGIVAFITSHYTMDAKDTTVRRYLAEQATLLGAIRLPNTAFKSNAGTEVVTDIVFLQKKDGSRAAQSEAWEESRQTDDHAINEYFLSNPRMVLGRHASTGLRHRDNEYTVEPTGDLAEQLASAVSLLPSGMYAPPTTAAAAVTAHLPSQTRPAADVSDGAWFIEDGQLFTKRGDERVPAALSPPEAARVRGLIGVREALRHTMDTMLRADATPSQIKSAQRALNSRYDVFVKKHGYLAKRQNYKVFREDPDVYTMLALEHWTPKATKPELAAIFTARTLRPHVPVESVETPKEALLVSLNETGRVDWARMSALTGRSSDDLQAALEGLVFHDPGTDTWEQADRYLSGNVKAKLRAATEAAATTPSYVANVEALTRVQPADLLPTDIAIRLGSPWVPPDVIDAFAAHLGLSGLRFSYSPALAKWSMDTRRFHGGHTTQNTAQWGTDRKLATELLATSLNLGTPVVYDTVQDANGEKRVVNQKDTLAAREKQEAIAQEFRSWVWEDPSRASALSGIYNETMNTMRLWEPDGSHLSLPGTNPAITFRPHQKNFIWRGLQQANALAHHVVGAGKTFAGIALALEKRRLGLARKPMVVVPNHLVQQWARDGLRLYPAARVLASTKADFDPKNRKRFLNRIATGDWDIVIVPMSHFGRIKVGDAIFNEYVRRELSAYETELRRARELAGKNDPTVKELEKSKLNLEAKLRTTKEGQAKDAQVLTFEQLGVDMLMVDEAHNYKKLGFPTKMTRVAGVPAGPGSQRAFDLMVKSSYLATANPTGGTVFLTGTPISNTMAEMYVLMRYLAQPALDERGIPQFDGWAATFGDTVTAFEISPTGRGFRQKTRFAKFTNLPELVQLYRSVADVQTADMLKLPTPPLKGGKAAVHVVDASPDIDAFVETLLERYAAVLGLEGRQRPDPSVDNPLKITTDGRKAALDLRLVGLDQPDGGKVDQVTERIKAIWDRTAASKGTQLVFADLGTPSKRAKAVDIGDFTVYDAIRDRLSEIGIPREQVAFIQEANTDARKQALFDSMNAGDVRVLIGSSETMGAGMNVQQRLVALHHMDAPWRPSDIEQREGRILRQGNDFLDPESSIYDKDFEVEIHTYVTERSFDAYLWQLLENKARFIRQALKGDVTARETDDADDVVLNYAQAKGAASGNPAIMEHAKTQSDVQRMEASEANHDRRKWRLQRELASLPEQIARTDREIANAQAVVDAVRMPTDRSEFSITIDGKALRGQKASEAIAAKFEQSRTGPRRQLDAYHLTTQEVSIGTAAGVSVRGYYAISNVFDPPSVVAKLVIAAGGATMEKNAATGAGAMNSLAIFIENDPSKRLNQYTREAETLRGSLSVAQTEVAKPFQNATKLTMLRTRLKDLEALLNLDAKSQQAEAAAVSTIVQTEAEAQADLDAERAAEEEGEVSADAELVEPTAGETVVDELDRIAQAAKDRLAERGTFKGTKLGAGIPVDDITDLVIIGAAKIAKGTVQFAQWSAEMVREFGEVIRPHLRAIFEDATLRAKAFGPIPVHVESGRELLPTKPIPAARVLDFPSLQKMPAAIRGDIEEMLQRYQGFEAQRRGVQTWDRTQERAKDVWLPLETLRPGKALNAEELEAYKTAIATALTLRQPILAKIQDGTATDWDRLQASHLTDVATVLTASYRGAKAEAGRALNILRAKGRVLDLRESRFLEMALKAPGFNANLTRLSKEALDAAGDPLKQLQLLRRRSGTAYDLFMAYYYGNLLSGIKTQERNLIGNSFNSIVNILTPVGAVPVDIWRARRTGERTVFLGEVPKALRGSLVGLERGLRNGAFTFVQGFRPRTVEGARLGQFDTPRVELPGGVWNPWNVPGRALEAVDEVFRAIAHHQELYAGVYAQAQREGLTDATAIRNRMADLLAAADPTTADGKIAAQILERTEAFEDRAVFQEPAGHIVRTIMRLKDPGVPIPVRLAATFIMPFVRISGAITRQGFEYSPVGFGMRGARGAMGKGRVQSQAQGRALIGSLALLPMAWLAVTGRLTGAPPDDPGEREEFYARGMLSNAVKVGDYWVRYVLFQPFSVPMAAVATAWAMFKDSDQDEAAAQEAVAAAVAGAGASILDQSFLAGLGSVMDAVNDPVRYGGQWFSLLAQGFVPLSGLMRNVTQAVDPVIRRPRGVSEAVKAIIPGVSQSVSARRTRTGEQAQRPGGPIQRGFVVPEVSREVDDVVTRTLADLGVHPQAPRGALTRRGEAVDLTDAQEDIIAEAIGRERKTAITAIITAPSDPNAPESFHELPDEAKAERLQNALERAGAMVRGAAVARLGRSETLTVEGLVSARTREAMRRERNDIQRMMRPSAGR